MLQCDHGMWRITQYLCEGQPPLPEDLPPVDDDDGQDQEGRVEHEETGMAVRRRLITHSFSV